MFVVLVGSVAREDNNINSDIDICRIDTAVELVRKENWPSGPINYIDYNYKDFMHLYKQGSLFIYHILFEGILVIGDSSEWEMLKSNFIFIDNYDEEIFDISTIILEFLNINIFGNTFLALYSNMFTLIKNYAIYSLAQSGNFEFNKKKAFKLISADKYYDLLNDSYNRFERGLSEGNKWNYNSKTLAEQVMQYYIDIVEDIEC